MYTEHFKSLSKKIIFLQKVVLLSMERLSKYSKIDIQQKATKYDN